MGPGNKKWAGTLPAHFLRSPFAYSATDSSAVEASASEDSSAAELSSSAAEDSSSSAEDSSSTTVEDSSSEAEDSSSVTTEEVELSLLAVELLLLLLPQAAMLKAKVRAKKAAKIFFMICFPFFKRSAFRPSQRGEKRPGSGDTALRLTQQSLKPRCYEVIMRTLQNS